jgi:hypothetical protein
MNRPPLFPPLHDRDAAAASVSGLGVAAASRAVSVALFVISMLPFSGAAGCFGLSSRPSGDREGHAAETNRIRFVLFGMQNRALGLCAAATRQDPRLRSASRCGAAETRLARRALTRGWELPCSCWGSTGRRRHARSSASTWR